MYSMKIAGIVYIKGEFHILWASIGYEMLRVKYVGTDIPEIGDEVLAEGKIVFDHKCGRQFVVQRFRPLMKNKCRFSRWASDELAMGRMHIG